MALRALVRSLISAAAAAAALASLAPAALAQGIVMPKTSGMTSVSSRAGCSEPRAAPT